jgi:hypothetical protein
VRGVRLGFAWLDRVPTAPRLIFTGMIAFRRASANPVRSQFQPCIASYRPLSVLLICRRNQQVRSTGYSRTRPDQTSHPFSSALLQFCSSAILLLAVGILPSNCLWSIFGVWFCTAASFRYVRTRIEQASPRQSIPDT